MCNYSDLSKPADQPDLSERKDALIPDPQEFDFSDPDKARATCASAVGRLRVFERLAMNENLNEFFK